MTATLLPNLFFPVIFETMLQSASHVQRVGRLCFMYTRTDPSFRGIRGDVTLGNECQEFFFTSHTCME